MKKNTKRALLLSAVGLLNLASCGSTKGNTSYAVWFYTGVSSEYYSDYNSNPALQYLMSKSWNDKTIDFDFWIPPAGSAQNNYDTIIASGDYPVLLQNSVSDPAPLMYENNLIMDITELVKDNMPNYYNLIQSNQSLKNKTTFNIDGSEKILSITTLNESIPYTFTGMVYRRDWIVKYGTNPKTNVKFTGGYTDASNIDSWVDDVVFPSGGVDPVTISDWEWMFKIFTEAQKNLGINDSYCVSEYYSGYTWGTGGLNSCFGESNPVWYQSTKDGRKVEFGGTSNSMRAYLECLNTWYKNGWLDKSFNEHVNDMYYAIDSTNVRLGKVGMWQGLESDLGGRLDLHNGGYTDGIYVKGCSWPINDIYGTAECKNVEPNGVSIDKITGQGFFIMKGADKKDLIPLLKFIDYLYTEEGAVIRSLGLNKEQLSSIDTKYSSFYEKYNMSEGAYSIGKDGRYVVADSIKKDTGGLSVASCLDKFPGYQLVSSIDHGYEQSYEDSLKTWVKYGDSIKIWGSDASINMSSSDADAAQKALNQVLGYMDKYIYKYIKGEKDPFKDSDWNGWCSDLERFNYDKTTAILQKYCDLYPCG